MPGQFSAVINTTGVGATYVVDASIGTTINAAASTQAISINGSTDADTIRGGTGDDTITGGGGNDVINLDEAGGSDTVVFAATGNGADTIFAFTGGTGAEADVLDFSDFLAGGGFNTTVFTSADDAEANITNAVVRFDTAGAGLDVTGLIAEIEGDGNAFSLNGKAVVITGNAGGAADDALIYFVDSAADGTAGDVTAADVTLVGTLDNVNLSDLVAGNFVL